MKTNMIKNRVTNPSMWMKKGYSEEEAKEEIRKHQKMASKFANLPENKRVATRERLLELGYTEQDIIGIRSFPIQKEHWMYRYGMSEEEAIERVSEHQKKMSSRVDRTKDDMYPNQVNYWIKKGLSFEDATEEVSRVQTTFSLEVCIQKHGEKKGREIWLKRQEKWHNSYKKSNFSMVSQELFWSIYDSLSDEFKRDNDIFFATLCRETKVRTTCGTNEEYRLTLNDSFIRPDFFVLQKKRIIEFDGLYYHRGIPENAKRDLIRDTNIINSGYEVFHVNEMDFKTDKDTVLTNCINFLNS